MNREEREALKTENVELKRKEGRASFCPLEIESETGCEYCDEKNNNPLNWKYGLDHILEGYRYCPMCKRDLKEKDSEPRQRLKVKTIELPVGIYWQCPKCESIIRKDLEICTECGTELIWEREKK